MSHEVLVGSWIGFGCIFALFFMLCALVDGFYVDGARGAQKIFGHLFWISLLVALAISTFYRVANPPSPIPTHQQQLQQVGLLDQHDIRRIQQQVPGSSMEFAGHYFSILGFGGGGISGGASAPEPKLQFFWGRVYDGQEEFIFTTLPYSKLRFVIDDSKEVPTVEFLFYKSFLEDRHNSLKAGSYEVNNETDINDLLTGEDSGNRFQAAVVRISSSDLEKEVYLPKPK